jgi:integrase
MKTWTVEELRIFLAATADHRLGSAYLLAATTGIRRGEVLGLRWQDIDFQRRRLAVRQTVVTVNYQVSLGTPKTARRRRSVALDTTTITALKLHQAQQQADKAILAEGYRDQGLVFTKVDGTPVHPDYFSQLFDRTVAKLPVTTIRLHDLRHIHATLGAGCRHPRQSHV